MVSKDKVEVFLNSSSSPSSLPNLGPTLDLDWPIALQKGIRCTNTTSPHYVNLSYNGLSTLHYTCLSYLSLVSIPNYLGEALLHP